LDPFVGDRMSRLFGMNLRDVVVIPESPAATGATKAITKDGEVHFRAGACQPNTPQGDRLITHELAHVAQQRGGRGEREGTRKELDRRLRKVSLWLGHADMQTTMVYLRADPTEKIATVTAVVPMPGRRVRLRAPDALIASLHRR
jgi:hypothetical protein